MIAVAIVDHANTTGVDLVAIARALEKQVQQHFAPVYGISCTVTVASLPLPGAWTIGLFTDADQPGALGYHDIVGGLPLAKVFPLLDAQDGTNLSTTISHELLEMLADPFLRLAVQSVDGRFYAYEACDPCEQEEYEIDGVTVSDFVLPAWYVGGDTVDYLGRCTAPLTVNPGGYAQYYDPAIGWQQVLHAELLPRAYRSRLSGRSARRARGA